MGAILEIIVSMLGGLALFLYGMRMMSNGLELTAGNSMKSILEKLTSNKLISIIVGAAVTALVQSSSATTVMVVSFVDSSIMSLEQAVWIIIGANVGATMTKYADCVKCFNGGKFAGHYWCNSHFICETAKIESYRADPGRLGNLIHRHGTYVHGRCSIKRSRCIS